MLCVSKADKFKDSSRRSSVVSKQDNAESRQSPCHSHQEPGSTHEGTCYGFVVVELRRKERAGLGLVISGGRDKAERAWVSYLRPGSIAQRCDALEVGDLLVSVNGIRVNNLSTGTCSLRHDEIVSLLQTAGEKIVLEVEYPLLPPGTPTESVRSERVRVTLEKDSGSCGFTLRGGAQPDPDLSQPLTVMHIRPGSAADREGTLKLGDRILEVNGACVRGVSLNEALARVHRADVSVTLLVEYDVTVMEAVEHACGPLLVEIDKTPGVGLGLSLARSERGICIDAVKPASIADRCGALHEGDEILAIDDTCVQHLSVAEATALLRCSPRQTLRLEILPQSGQDALDEETATHPSPPYLPKPSTSPQPHPDSVESLPTSPYHHRASSHNPVTPSYPVIPLVHPDPSHTQPFDVNPTSSLPLDPSSLNCPEEGDVGRFPASVYQQYNTHTDGCCTNDGSLVYVQPDGIYSQSQGSRMPYYTLSDCENEQSGGKLELAGYDLINSEDIRSAHALRRDKGYVGRGNIGQGRGESLRVELSDRFRNEKKQSENYHIEVINNDRGSKCVAPAAAGVTHLEPRTERYPVDGYTSETGHTTHSDRMHAYSERIQTLPSSIHACDTYVSTSAGHDGGEATDEGYEGPHGGHHGEACDVCRRLSPHLSDDHGAASLSTKSSSSTPAQTFATSGGVCHTQTVEVLLQADHRGFGMGLQDSPFATEGLAEPPIIGWIEQRGVAERCGVLQEGDRVLGINRHNLENLTLDQATGLLHRAGSRVTLHVEFDVSDSVVPSSGVFVVKLATKGAGLGIQIKEPTGLQPGTTSSHLLISRVQPGSVAHRTGTLQAGDKLLAIDSLRMTVCSLEEAREALQHAGDIVRLRVQRDEPQGEEDVVSYTVVLEKRGAPLGITISGTEEATQPITISALARGGLTEKTGALRVGDELLAICGTSLHGVPLSEALVLLHQAGDIVTLTISRRLTEATAKQGVAVEAESGSTGSKTSSGTTPLPSLDSALESWDSNMDGAVPPHSHLPHSHTNTLSYSHANALPHSHTNALPQSHTNALPHSHTNSLPRSHTHAPPHSHVPAEPYATQTLPKSHANKQPYILTQMPGQYTKQGHPTAHTQPHITVRALPSSGDSAPNTPLHTQFQPNAQPLPHAQSPPHTEAPPPLPHSPPPAHTQQHLPNACGYISRATSPSHHHSRHNPRPALAPAHLPKTRTDDQASAATRRQANGNCQAQ